MNSLTWIRENYGVPAFRGREVLVDGVPGRIVGARDQYLRVRQESGIITAHPTWRVEYMQAK